MLCSWLLLPFCAVKLHITSGDFCSCFTWLWILSPSIEALVTVLDYTVNLSKWPFCPDIFPCVICGQVVVWEIFKVVACDHKNQTEAEQNTELPAGSSLLNSLYPQPPRLLFVTVENVKRLEPCEWACYLFFFLTEIMITYLWVWVSNHLSVLQYVPYLFRLYDCQFKSVKSLVKPKLYCL